MSKLCAKCKRFAEFYSNKAHHNGLSSWCKSCEKMQVKKWKKTNQERLKQEFYSLVNNFKNQPCADCLGWFEPCQMDLDHRNPAEKLQGIGLMMGYNRKKILDEIAKCDVVCANCHRLRTQKQNYLKKVLPCNS